MLQVVPQIEGKIVTEKMIMKKNEPQFVFRKSPRLGGVWEVDKHLENLDLVYLKRELLSERWGVKVEMRGMSY